VSQQVAVSSVAASCCVFSFAECTEGLCAYFLKMSVSVATQDVLKNSLVTMSSNSIPMLCCVSPAAAVLLSALCIEQGHSSSYSLCMKCIITSNTANIPGNKY
jgi:hypothetical protein